MEGLTAASRSGLLRMGPVQGHSQDTQEVEMIVKYEVMPTAYRIPMGQ